MPRAPLGGCERPRDAHHNHLARWWLAPAPPRRLAWVRVLVGLYTLLLLLGHIPALARRSSFDAARFAPVGLLSPLESPPEPLVLGLLVLLGLLGGVGFILGWRYRQCAPVYALALLALTSYLNSWGHLGHSQNLAVLQVLVLSLVPAADALSLDRRAGRTREGDPSRYGWPLRLLMLTVVVSYTLAGIAKLSNGGWAWAKGGAIHHHVAHDALRKLRLGTTISPLSAPLLRQPWVFPLFAAGTLATELGAAVAMAPGRLRLAWILSAWAMHVGILVTMGIAFWYPLSGIAFASFLPLERLLGRLVGRR